MPIVMRCQHFHSLDPSSDIHDISTPQYFLDNVECVLGDIINQIQFELSPNDPSFNDIYGLKINALKICQACSTIVQDEQVPSTIIFLNVLDKDNWDLQTIWDDYQNNEGYNDDYPCKRIAKSQGS